VEPRPYTSQWYGWRSFASVLLKDYRANRNPIARISQNIEEAQMMEDWAFGHRLSDCDILDIGPGQVPVQLMYFNMRNRAIGIDVNGIIDRRTPLALLRLAREDGMVRAVKTLGRWATGADSRTRRAAAAQLGVRTLEWPKTFRMDARDLRFSDASFDFIYLRSVFQHIMNPKAALHEIRRTLRPGGATHISLHLWTCPNGYTYVPAPNWEWPHLRGLAKPSDIEQSRNRLRLAEWRRIFDEVLPGTEFRLRGPETPEMIARAKELVKSELHEYSVEELVNYQLSALWKKSHL
jgi:SAM-dependent methyltransferase